jgi:hypothetical protein
MSLEMLMIRRLGVSLAVVCAGVFALASPAAAQQTINFTFGYFVPRGEDARVDDDVLVRTREVFGFDVADFNGPAIGAEWLVPVGRYLEAGAGIGFSRRTVATSYLGYVDADGFEIEQDLRLRIVPIAFTFRAVPLGQQSPVQPYIGAGLGLFNYRYSEVGDFIDFSVTPDPPIFRESYVATGTGVGPIVLGGVRFASDTFSAGGEVRYQRADVEIDPDQFFGSRLDLGGWTYQVTVGVRFGR